MLVPGRHWAVERIVDCLGLVCLQSCQHAEGGLHLCAHPLASLVCRKFLTMRTRSSWAGPSRPACVMLT